MWLNPQAFARAIFDKGSPLRDCWGFTDGTARPIFRPIFRPVKNQRIMFSSHKRTHCLKFQVCQNFKARQQFVCYTGTVYLQFVFPLHSCSTWLCIVVNEMVMSRSCRLALCNSWILIFCLFLVKSATTLNLQNIYSNNLWYTLELV